MEFAGLDRELVRHPFLVKSLRDDLDVHFTSPHQCLVITLDGMKVVCLEQLKQCLVLVYFTGLNDTTKTFDRG